MSVFLFQPGFPRVIGKRDLSHFVVDYLLFTTLLINQLHLTMHRTISGIELSGC